MKKVAPYKGNNSLYHLSVVNQGTFCYSLIDTNYSIDLSKASKLMAEVEVINTTQNILLCVDNRRTFPNPWDGHETVSLLQVESKGTHNLEANVSELNSGYISLYINSGISSDYFGTICVKKIWLEK